MTPCRFPPPWSVDDPDMKLGRDCYIVREPTNRRFRLSLRGRERHRVSTGERSGKDQEPVTKVCSNSDRRVDQSTCGCPLGRSSTKVAYNNRKWPNEIQATHLVLRKSVRVVYNQRAQCKRTRKGLQCGRLPVATRVFPILVDTNKQDLRSHL